MNRRLFLISTALVVAAGTGIATGLTSGAPSPHTASTAPDQPTTSTSSSSSTMIAAPRPTDGELLHATGRCANRRCRIVDRIDGLDTPDGPATLIAFHNGADDGDNTVFMALVAGGHVVWQPDTEYSFYMDPAQMKLGGIFVRDASGNILAEVVVGAHTGVVLALRVSRDGIDDFGSGDIDHGTDSWDGEHFVPPTNPFYGNGGAKIVKGPKGIHDIDVLNSNYVPSFAEGKITTTTLRWNGTRYVEVARSTT